LIGSAAFIGVGGFGEGFMIRRILGSLSPTAGESREGEGRAQKQAYYAKKAPFHGVPFVCLMVTPIIQESYEKSKTFCRVCREIHPKNCRNRKISENRDFFMKTL
jgi:hypothetical protein